MSKSRQANQQQQKTNGYIRPISPLTYYDQFNKQQEDLKAYHKFIQEPQHLQWKQKFIPFSKYKVKEKNQELLQNLFQQQHSYKLKKKYLNNHTEPDQKQKEYIAHTFHQQPQQQQKQKHPTQEQEIKSKTQNYLKQIIQGKKDLSKIPAHRKMKGMDHYQNLSLDLLNNQSDMINSPHSQIQKKGDSQMMKSKSYFFNTEPKFDISIQQSTPTIKGKIKERAFDQFRTSPKKLLQPKEYLSKKQNAQLFSPLQETIEHQNFLKTSQQFQSSNFSYNNNNNNNMSTNSMLKSNGGDQSNQKQKHHQNRMFRMSNMGQSCYNSKKKPENNFVMSNSSKLINQKIQQNIQNRQQKPKKTTKIVTQQDEYDDTEQVSIIQSNFRLKSPAEIQKEILKHQKKLNISSKTPKKETKNQLLINQKILKKAQNNPKEYLQELMDSPEKFGQLSTIQKTEKVKQQHFLQYEDYFQENYQPLFNKNNSFTLKRENIREIKKLEDSIHDLIVNTEYEKRSNIFQQQQ